VVKLVDTRDLSILST